MRVLMLGWEFPPYISGGLGTACYGLTCAMENLDVEIVMLLPTNTQSISNREVNWDELRLMSEGLKHVIFKKVPYVLPNPYQTQSQTQKRHPVRVFGTGQPGGYDGNLIERVYEYAHRCIELIKINTFDVIHAHDWVTFPAAVALSSTLERPLIVHIHATEFDRSGKHINRAVYEIERQGLDAASAVIAVSNYTADVLTRYYGVPAEKIRVVHNGINPKSVAPRPSQKHSEAVVLFVGRITSQKGPEFFVKAAEQILSKYDNVKFVMAGWGDLAPGILEMVAAKRLGSKIFFTGFLRGREVDNIYQMADVFVMPSVSEPFGLTALEAVQHGLPVILSKTTGVGEVLRDGALKADFWDVNKMAKYIVDVLNDPALAEDLRSKARKEICNLTWDTAARKCVSIYNSVSEQSELIEQKT